MILDFNGVERPVVFDQVRVIFREIPILVLAALVQGMEHDARRGEVVTMVAEFGHEKVEHPIIPLDAAQTKCFGDFFGSGPPDRGRGGKEVQAQVGEPGPAGVTIGGQGVTPADGATGGLAPQGILNPAKVLRNDDVGIDDGGPIIESATKGGDFFDGRFAVGRQEGGFGRNHARVFMVEVKNPVEEADPGTVGSFLLLPEVIGATLKGTEGRNDNHGGERLNHRDRQAQ